MRGNRGPWDRLILEGDPYSILEAMAIAGFAVGAHQGIFMSAANTRKHPSFEIAISRPWIMASATTTNLIFFRIDIRKGAGAYMW